MARKRGSSIEQEGSAGAGAPEVPAGSAETQRRWLDRHGEMSALIHAHDWAATALGPIPSWPQSLKTAVGIMLGMRHPALIYWGPDLLCLYNDAFAALLDPEKHPAVLGRPAAEAWPEAYLLIGPELQQVMAGAAIWAENRLTPIRRHGRIEENFWTYSRSPILDPQAPTGVGGVLDLVSETTAAVVARHQSEAQFEALANLVPGHLWRNDASGGVTWANQRALDYAGRPLAALLEDKWKATVHPDDRAAVVQIVETAFATQQPIEYEHRLRGADGQYRWFLGRLEPVRDASGQVTQWFGATTDIHEQRLARDALAESEERLRLGMEVAGFGIGDVDLRAEQQVLSPELLAIFGLQSNEQIANYTHQEFAARFVHPDDQEQMWAAMAAVRDPGGPGTYIIEHRIVRADGEIRWIQVRGRAIFEGEGDARQAVRLIAAVLDITERKRAEQQLAASEERLRLAQELGGVGSFDWDVGRQEAKVSDSFRRIYGIPPDCQLTRAFAEQSTYPEDLPSYHAAIAAAIAGSQDLDIEYRIRRPLDGELRWIHARGGVVRGADGSAVRCVGIVSDITERKQAREREQLLMAEVDHRARNLLTVLQSVVQMTQAPNTADFVAALKGRIKALARAHTLLASSRWDGAELDRLLREELAPIDAGHERTTIAGPTVALKPAAAQLLALALHELATNAVKHGALSVPGGHVAVSWTVDEGTGELSLRWEERGGPPTAPPSRTGFGTSVIQGGVAHQLGGGVRMDWQDKGLACELTLPGAQFVA